MSEENNGNLEKLTLAKLYDNKPLFSKVISLMQRKESYDFIIKYIESKGKSISKGSLSNLKSKMLESSERGIPLEDLLDKRRKTSITDVPDDKIIGYKGNQPTDTQMNNVISEMMPPKRVYTNQQVLETLMQKGMAGLQNIDNVDTSTLLKATELNQKYFGSKTGGLTEESFKQYKIIMHSSINAMMAAMAQFVPEEKQEEALEAVSTAFEQEISKVGTTDEGAELLKWLNASGIDLNID